MSLIDISLLCMFIVFAQLTESRVLILRDYDDEPFVLDHVERSSEDVKQEHQVINSNFKPKRTHSKKTVLQYGRHIYHLDNFADLKDLRSIMTQFKPDSFSYDYVDVDALFRARGSANNGVGDYLKNLFIYSTRNTSNPQFCNGYQCDEGLRKFNKHKNDDDTNSKQKNKQFGRIKRFQIVNRHKSKKPQSDSSEEYHKKKKQKTSKKKKKKYFSESAESKSKESGSAEESWGSRKKTKKKFKPSKSIEESAEIKRKRKKKHNDDDSSSAGVEKWRKHDKHLKSNEDFQKKKKKQKNYGARYETKRKSAKEDDFFMQGNKIFSAKERKTKKKHYDFDKRRRLEHFLPKRYHWDASEIDDLGYYWFNGPKGKYAAPKRLYI